MTGGLRLQDLGRFLYNLKGLVPVACVTGDAATQLVGHWNTWVPTFGAAHYASGALVNLRVVWLLSLLFRAKSGAVKGSMASVRRWPDYANPGFKRKG